MSMGELHEHGRTTCAYEGVNGVNTRLFRRLLLPLLLRLVLPIVVVHRFRLIQTSRSSVYLPLCTPSSANRRLDSVRSGKPLAFAHKILMIMSEPHENEGIA